MEEFSQSQDVEVFDFRKSNTEETDQVWELKRPVFFVGFMGAGKTSVSRKLARLAGVASIDLDTYIERHCDTKITDIFNEAGEEAFREIETKTLQSLAEGEPCLISCGGGIVVKPENREILKNAGYVVYLQVTADEAASRISDTSSRPLFNDLERARELSLERLPLYEEVADLTIDTSGRNAGTLAHTAFKALKKDGVLWQSK